MNKAQISLVENTRVNGTSLRYELQSRNYAVTVFHNLAQALRSAQSQDAPTNLLIIDAISKNTPGTQLAQKARNALSCAVILLSPAGTPLLVDDPAFAHLIEPFTIRKVNNRIRQLMLRPDARTKRAGPFKLVPSERKVIVNGTGVSLTPMTFALLNMLAKHEGEAVSREEIFKEVWETDYVGDMRTLDTHIAWLRQAIEQDPHKPEFLKTVWGVGYRLEGVCKEK